MIEFGRREANRNKCPGVGHLLRNNQDVCSLPSRSLAATMGMHRRERWPFKGYKCMPNGIRKRNLSNGPESCVGRFFLLQQGCRMRAVFIREGGDEWATNDKYRS